MRVCYFWFTEWKQALELLDKHAPGAERLWTGPDSQGYWRQFARAWENPDDSLLVIEQDVGIHENVIPEMEACPEPWCAFESRIGGLTARGLGCTKFSRELREQVTVQDIMCPVPHQDKTQCTGVYCNAYSPGMSACHNRHTGCRDCGSFCHRHIDGPVCDALYLIAGLKEPHVHYPPVRHFHYELRSPFLQVVDKVPGVTQVFLKRTQCGIAVDTKQTPDALAANWWLWTAGVIVIYG